MNWYKVKKIAQIWDVPVHRDDDSFSVSGENFITDLRAIYELSYKYNMLKSMPFEGHPTRWNKILKQLQQKLIYTGNYVKNILLEVFSEWLDKHAILNPRQWAEKRIEDSMGESYIFAFESIFGEYSNYMENKPNYGYVAFNTMIRDAINKIDSLPSFRSFLEQFLLEGYRERVRYDYKEEPEEFSERYSIKVNSEEELENYLDSLTLKDLDIFEELYISGIEDVDSLARAIEESVEIDEEILIEFNENLVFPIWYRKWSKEGIDKTRANIEKIYKQLSSANPLDTSNFTSIINIAIQCTHQTGQMASYLVDKIGSSSEQEILDVFYEVTRSLDSHKWDKELQGIGTSFSPEKLKNPHIYPNTKELLSDEEKAKNELV